MANEVYVVPDEQFQKGIYGNEVPRKNTDQNLSDAISAIQAFRQVNPVYSPFQAGTPTFERQAFQQNLAADQAAAALRASRGSGGGSSNRGLTAKQQLDATTAANTNDFIGQLMKFYSPAKAQQFLEDNAGTAAANGVDMMQVLKAAGTKWPNYFEDKTYD